MDGVTRTPSGPPPIAAAAVVELQSTRGQALSAPPDRQAGGRLLDRMRQIASSLAARLTSSKPAADTNTARAASSGSVDRSKFPRRMNSSGHLARAGKVVSGPASDEPTHFATLPSSAGSARTRTTAPHQATHRSNKEFHTASWAVCECGSSTPNRKVCVKRYMRTFSEGRTSRNFFCADSGSVTKVSTRDCASSHIAAA